MPYNKKIQTITNPVAEISKLELELIGLQLSANMGLINSSYCLMEHKRSVKKTSASLLTCAVT